VIQDAKPQIEELRKAVEQEIMLTPSGMRRNHLTTINIQAMVLLDALRMLAEFDARRRSNDHD
jgi:hypothetical protein